MNRDRVYLFQDGNWCWSDEGHLPRYTGQVFQEIIVGTGWNDNEVSRMIQSYHEENLSTFEDE